LWQDTLLIVNTDHGYLLGEHDWWAKIRPPWYNELAHTPLFVWDPRSKAKGVRRQALVQTIDLAPTLLEFFGVPRPVDMMGVPLRETISGDAPVRQAGLFGVFGGQLNVTDGRYVYMRGCSTPRNKPLYEYTLMTTHMRHTFAVQELQDLQLAVPFSFTKGCRTLKIAGRFIDPIPAETQQTLLFDLHNDPRQMHPLDDPDVEQYMIDHLLQLMDDNDAPHDQYVRLGLQHA